MELNQASILARKLMFESGVTGYTFKFDNARSRFGLCSYKSKTISISRYLTQINPESEVRTVILHEIAHALLGPGYGHGYQWQRMARSLGIQGARTHSAQTPAARYLGTCPNCGNTAKRHRMRESSKSMACKTCCDKFNAGRWDERFVFTWVDNEASYV